MTQPTLVMQNEPWFVPNLMKRGRRSLDRLHTELLQLQNGTVYLGHRVILLRGSRFPPPRRHCRHRHHRRRLQVRRRHHSACQRM